ncbi:hypothetical protein HNY73_022600 [Argiope bruennichi]|uniref:Uncharacterized protein n=1 Tax=Argiope bruennichi TaxID=94029 RepID=A0A8T0E2X2_ARGBR|nr:hypothetical protein HNY73_022600 [Argiope bruennichi]
MEGKARGLRDGEYWEVEPENGTDMERGNQRAWGRGDIEGKRQEDIPLRSTTCQEVSRSKNATSEDELMELTSKHEITERKGDADTRQSSPRKQVVVRLEPSLGEKLAKKRATADEMEDKLQTLRFDFKNKLQSVDHMKKELNNLEAHLLQSVQKVEGYMRQIYSLKREADDLFEKLKSTSIQLALDFSILTREYDYLHSKIGASVAILKRYRPAQSCFFSQKGPTWFK